MTVIEQLSDHPIAVGAIGLMFIISMMGAVAAVQTVDEGHTKVVKEKGNAQGTLEPGQWYMINPVTQGTVSIDTRPQLYEMTKSKGGEKAGRDDSIKVITRDELEVPVDVAVSYRVSDPITFYEKWKSHSQARQRLIRTTVRDAVYSEGGNMSTSELPTKEGRTRLKAAVRDALIEGFNGSGVALINVDIRGMYPPKQYMNAVEQKQIKKQEIQKAQYEVEVSKKQAKKKKIDAKAARDANLIRAQAYQKPGVLEAMYMKNLKKTDTVYIPVNSNGVPTYVDATSNSSSSANASNG